MLVELHPEAQQELSEQALFYEHRESGLGFLFIDAIEAALEILAIQPYIGQQVDQIFRAVVLVDFPFTLVYTLEPERIWIIAVAHQSRLPDYWRPRVSR